MIFKIEGKIKSKDRPRTNFKTNAIYTPKATTDYEKKIRKEFLKNKRGVFVGDISISICANFEIPKSYTKKEKIQAEKGLIRPKRKIDIDNIAKIVLDALNKTAYNDDNQVKILMIEKRYTTNTENIVIEIKEL